MVAEELWTGVAQAYARSFAGLCAGALAPLTSGFAFDVSCVVAEARVPRS